MAISGDLKKFALSCTEISNEVSTPSGFVPVSRLASRFDAELIFRPLLVEGMLAESDNKSKAEKNYNWAVLLDSETYGYISDLRLQNEIIGEPLSPRLRSTIAHELAHSLAFRYKEFGIELTKVNSSKKSLNEYVEEIEKETDKLSPLLLVPYKFLVQQYPLEKTNTIISDLIGMQRLLGISRYVLINRFRLFRLIDQNGLLHHRGIRNIAIGIGEWINENEIKLKDWPLFLNFDKNLVPEFLLKLVKKQLSSTDNIFTANSAALFGNLSRSVELTLFGGTSLTSSAEEMKVVCEVEPVDTRKRGEFLFLIRKISGNHHHAII